MAQMAVVRPLAVAHLCDEPGLDPAHVALAHARHLRNLGERRRVPLQRLHQLEQLADLGVVESRADVPDVAQLAALVHREHERTERAGATTGTRGVADDDELVGVLRLQFQPVARATPRLVGRIDALRDDPFEVLRSCDLEERVAVLEPFRHGDRARSQVDQLRESRLALVQRQIDERLAVELEQVERVVDELPRALLQLGEARAPGRVDPRHLAVDDRVRASHRLDERPGHVAEATRQVVAVPRDELALAGTDVRERAVAVELDLERPPLAVRDVLLLGREHRPVLPLDDVVRGLVVALDQEPVLLLPVQVGRDERPASVQTCPVETYGELAVPLLLEQLVRAVVPDLDRAAAVLALRDLAVERRVLERVVLDVDGERPRARLERHSLRHRPRGEGAVPLEAEVVVEPARVVALDDEDRQRGASLRAREGLRRLARIPLAGGTRRGSYPHRCLPPAAGERTAESFDCLTGG